MMNAQCSVITAGHIATDHIAALEALRGDVTVQRRCADLAELIAVAGFQKAQAALIIGNSEQLGETLVDQLLANSLYVVVISDLASERERLQRLGLRVFNDDVPAETLADALNTQVRSPGYSAYSDQPMGTVDDAASDYWESLAQVEQGHIAVIWGTPGAPGRTTVAVNMAAELAISGVSTLLVDADTHAASVAVHLGLLEESAGVARLCRAADVGDLDERSFQAATVSVEVSGEDLDVLTGLPRADRWPEVRPRSLQRVLEFARGRYEAVVVDVSSGIEQDEELSYDTAAPQRHGAAIAALQYADRVLAIGTADPVGFSRLMRSAEEHRLQLPEAVEPEIIVNAVRREVVGRAPRRQLSLAWEELGPPRQLSSFLPTDRASCDFALRNGQVLAEAAPESELRRQIADLVGIKLPSPRRRLLRRARSS